MRRYTETYNVARRAGAKPIILAYVESSMGMYCFGKETPQEAHIDPSLSVLDWSPRVLIFGDFSQRLSSNSDNVFLSLEEEEMTSYTLTCDNVDFFFSILSGSKTFLGFRLILVQGFDYPGFTYADFQPLFAGTISEVKPDNRQCLFVAQQSATPETPADPTIDTGKIYALSNAGSGFTGASGTFSYASMSPVFYGDDSWTFSAELDKDTLGVAETLFRIENNAFNEDRVQIGINTSNQVFVRYTDDVNTASPTYETVTADWALTADSTRVIVDYDAASAQYTISDNTGYRYIQIVLTPGAISADSFVATAGAGTDELYFARRLTVTGVNDVWIVVYDRVKHFSSGVYVGQFGSQGLNPGEFSLPIGIDTDSFGNFFVSDRTTGKIQKFTSAGVYVSYFGGYGSTDGLFFGADAVAIDTNDNVYVVDYPNHRVQKFNSSGTFLLKFGTSGTGNGQFASPRGIAIDSLNNVYVSDSGNNRVQKFDDSGNYVSQFGSSGTGDGQFNDPRGITIDPTSGNIFVTDAGNDRIQRFDSSFGFSEAFGVTGSGLGEFGFPQSIGVDTFGNIFVVDGAYDTCQKLVQGTGIAFEIDMSDTGSSDDVFVLEDFDGTSSHLAWNDTLSLVSDSNTNTDWPDLISGLDVPLVDGTWTDVADLDTITDAIEDDLGLDPLSELILPDSGRYANTGENQQNVILPLPYGNCIENSDAAVWVCPAIDTINHVYCVAGWPIQSVANGNTISVYVDNVLTPTGWVFDESDNYESQGNVAILTFSADPGGIVSVRCNGKWVDGALLTNPVDIISDWIDYASELLGNVAWEKDTTSFAQGKAFCDSASFVAAGVILSNNSLGFWIKNILASFMGSFSFNPAGQVQLSFLPVAFVSNVVETLDEYEAIQVNTSWQVSNVLKQVTTNYAISYATVDRRFKNNAETSYFRTIDDVGDAELTGAKVAKFNFDWNRNTDSVNLIHQVLFALYGEQQVMVNYQGQDFKFLPLDLLDQISATLRLIRDDTGNIVVDKIYELREKVINLDDFTSTLSLQAINPLVNINTGDAVYIGTSRVYIGASPVFLG